MSNAPPVSIDPPIIYPQPDLYFNNMTIQVMNISLGVSASFIVYLFNNQTMVSTRNYTMEGEDYNNWGNDDQYVYNWILDKLRAETIILMNKSSITTEPNVSSETQPNVSSETQPNVSSETQPNVSSETQPDVSSETQPDVSSETQPNVSSETQPNVSSETQPDV